MALPLGSLAAILLNTRLPEPRIVNLPAPPSLTGALDPNSNRWLSKAVVYATNRVHGPESMVFAEGNIYTGLSDGWIVEVNLKGSARRVLRMSIRACDTTANEENCGRPLGIRRNSNGLLIVVDPYKGIFKIDPKSGNFETLVDAKEKVNNISVGFINDLTLSRTGKIYFSSSSSRWTHEKRLNILLEGERSGRVLIYNPWQSDPDLKVQEVLTKLSFPDGLQLSEDETYLLIAERARARIHRAYVGDHTPKRGHIEVFANNLPGFPDNIRRSPRGTYWVGLAHVRHKDFPSLLDRFGKQPTKRLEYMSRPASEVLHKEFPRHGLALELDENGSIIRSLQDPYGDVFTSVSQVEEVGDYLFVASPNHNYIGLIRLSDVLHGPLEPPPYVTELQISTTPKPHPIATSPPPKPTSPLAQWLDSIAQNLEMMSSSGVRNVLVRLVLVFIDAAVETRRASERLIRVENELLQLRSQFNLGLTEHQKQLIRKSWQDYNTGPKVLEDTVLIFVRLFNDAPDSIPLFSHLGVVTQADTQQAEASGPGMVNEASLVNNTRFMGLVRKVAGALQAAVSNLDNPDSLATLLTNLGARHAAYGVQMKHFPPVRAGIFDAMKRRLGASFTLEIRQAWESLLDLLFSRMKQGMSQATVMK